MSDFEPRIILKLFLSAKTETSLENQWNIQIIAQVFILKNDS